MVINLVRYGIVIEWYAMVCHAMRCDAMRCDAMPCMPCHAMPCHAMPWRGMVWYGMVWYGLVWYGMVWYEMVYGVVWYGTVRNGKLYFCATLFLIFTGDCAGDIILILLTVYVVVDLTLSMTWWKSRLSSTEQLININSVTRCRAMITTFDWVRSKSSSAHRTSLVKMLFLFLKWRKLSTKRLNFICIESIKVPSYSFYGGLQGMANSSYHLHRDLNWNLEVSNGYQLRKCDIHDKDYGTWHTIRHS